MLFVPAPTITAFFTSRRPNQESIRCRQNGVRQNRPDENHPITIVTASGDELHCGYQSPFDADVWSA